MARWFPSIILVLTLCACSSKSTTGVDNTCGLAPPDAGADRNVEKNRQITLQATSDNDGHPNYHWTLRAPDGGAAPFETYDQGFSQDAELVFWSSDTGTYTATVRTVSSCGASEDVTVHLTTHNLPPTANAGEAQTVLKKTETGLWGRDSSDPDWDQLAYHWVLLSAPAGSTAELADANSDVAYLTPDVEGEYRVGLSVNDGTVESAQVATTVIATDRAPSADAGPDFSAVVGRSITLSGQASDPDADALAYQWTIVSAPPGSAALLSSPTVLSPSFVPDEEGPYVFSLVARDLTQASPASTLTVTAYHPIAPLSHDVVDARYDAALQKVVLISSTPPALELYDPDGGSERSVALPYPPQTLALSLDGQEAAVGYNGHASIVSLASGDAGTPISLPIDVFSVALTPTELCATSTGYTMEPLYTYHRAAGTTSASSSLDQERMALELHPDGGVLYGTSDVFSLEKVTFDKNRTAQVDYLSSDFGASGTKLWFTQEGDRLVSNTAVLYTVNPSANSNADDLTDAGILPGYDGYASDGLVWLDHSAAAGELAVIPAYSSTAERDAHHLQRFRAADLTLASDTLLPAFVADGGATPAVGRFVFHSNDGTRLYVVVKQKTTYPSDPAPWGLVTY